ncbi:hypothetical protein GCM10023088_28370 [Actinomadura verrucosospora]
MLCCAWDRGAGPSEPRGASRAVSVPSPASAIIRRISSRRRAAVVCSTLNSSVVGLRHRELG